MHPERYNRRPPTTRVAMPSAGALSPENLARQSEIVGLTRNGFQEIGNGESYSTTILVSWTLASDSTTALPCPSWSDLAASIIAQQSGKVMGELETPSCTQTSHPETDVLGQFAPKIVESPLVSTTSDQIGTDYLLQRNSIVSKDKQLCTSYTIPALDILVA